MTEKTGAEDFARTSQRTGSARQTTVCDGHPLASGDGGLMSILEYLFYYNEAKLKVLAGPQAEREIKKSPVGSQGIEE
jgi:hypothetical protein